MKTLTLKQLACYLPFELQMRNKGELFELTTISIKDPDYPIWANNYWDGEKLRFYPEINVKDTSCGKGFTLEEIQPIVYPLSMLTQEIEHKGERFVPIKRLQQTQVNILGAKSCYQSGTKSILIVGTEKEHLKYEIDHDMTTVSWSDVQKLIEWHFWIFDQSYFEKGLVIDKSKVK